MRPALRLIINYLLPPISSALFLLFHHVAHLSFSFALTCTHYFASSSFPPCFPFLAFFSSCLNSVSPTIIFPAHLIHVVQLHTTHYALRCLGLFYTHAYFCITLSILFYSLHPLTSPQLKSFFFVFGLLHNYPPLSPYTSSQPHSSTNSLHFQSPHGAIPPLFTKQSRYSKIGCFYVGVLLKQGEKKKKKSVSPIFHPSGRLKKTR